MAMQHTPFPRPRGRIYPGVWVTANFVGFDLDALASSFTKCRRCGYFPDQCFCGGCAKGRDTVLVAEYEPEGDA